MKIQQWINHVLHDPEILSRNLFKNNNQSFISNFDIEVYEMNKENNDVINISKLKNVLSNEKEEWNRDESFVNYNMLYNNIDQETEYLSTYENE